MSTSFRSKKDFVLVVGGLAIVALFVAWQTAAADEKKEPTGLVIADVKHDGLVDFESEVLPILRRNCLACHSQSEAENDLVLETPQTIIRGGSEGAAVKRGDPSASLLLKVSAHQLEPFMPPPDNKVVQDLTPEELGLIKLWIQEGAQGEVQGSGPVPWQRLASHVDPVYAVAVAPQGDFVAAGRGNQIFVYHVPTRQLIGKLIDPELSKSEIYADSGVAHLDLVQSLAFSPDGQLLASGGFRSAKLWRRVDAQQRTNLQGVESPPRSATASPDGNWFAVGEEGGNIRLFDKTGKLVRSLNGHSGPVTGLAFAPDSAAIVSGSQDKTVRVWKIADGAELAKSETPAAANAVAVVADGKQVAIGGADNKIRIWSFEAEPESDEGKLKEIAGHTGPISSLATLPGDPNQLVSGSQDGTVRIWSIKDSRQVRQISHGGPVTSVAARPDGKRLASTSSNNTAKLWDAANGQQIAELRGDYRTRQRAAEAQRAFDLARRHVDLSKKDLEEANKRKKAEEDNAKKVAENKKKTQDEMNAKVEAAKKPVADKEAAQQKLNGAKTDQATREGEKAKAEEQAKLVADELKKAQDEAGKAEDKAAANKKVADATAKKKQADEALRNAQKQLSEAQNKLKQAEGEYKKSEAPAQKALDEKLAAERAFQAAERSVTRSGELIKQSTAAVADAGTAQKNAEEQLKQREASKAAVDQSVGQSDKPLNAVAFSPDGRHFAVASDNGQVRIYGSEKGGSLANIDAGGGRITQLCFTADGGLLAAAEDKSTKIWDAAPSWKLERTIGETNSPTALIDRVTALDFSGDGKLLATGGGEASRSGELKIWNVADGQLVREVKEAHSDTILALQFSPDNKYIATAATDRFMKAFDVAAGSLVNSFEGHTHHVLGVNWHADGRTLASCGADKVIKVWDFRSGDQKKTISGFGKEVTSLVFVGLTENMIVGTGDRQVTTRNTGGSGGTNYGGAGGFVYSVGVSDDGATVVAGGEDSVVRVWSSNGQSVVNFEPPQPPAEDAVDKQAAK